MCKYYIRCSIRFLIIGKILQKVQGIDPACALGPVVESDTVSDRFLAKLPQRGEELNTEIPWIVGQTSAEAILLVDGTNKKQETYLRVDYNVDEFSYSKTTMYSLF